MKRVAMILAATSILLAGCMPGGTGKVQTKDQLLFDAGTKLSFRNHVKPVLDPAGGKRIHMVLVGERVSKTMHHLVFMKKGGFFTVPEGHKGAVVVRLFVRKERRVRIALVAGKKLKSYYLQVPAEGEWCELVLPLKHIEKKIAAGQAVNDISIWLLGAKLPSGKPAKLEKGSKIYLDRVSFRP